MNETKTNLTLKQRQRMQGKAQSEPKPSRGTSGNKEVSRFVAILLFLLAFGGGTALGMMYFRTDPRLEEIEDIQAVMAEARQDVRGDLMGRAWDLTNQLPSDLRSKVGMGRDREGARMEKFFAMSSADQLKQLQQEAARDKEREERRAEMEQQAPATPAADSSQANNNGNNSKGGGRRGQTDQQRTQRQEQRLANSSPQQRSQGTLYRQMRNSMH